MFVCLLVATGNIPSDASTAYTVHDQLNYIRFRFAESMRVHVSLMRNIIYVNIYIIINIIRINLHCEEVVILYLRSDISIVR